MYDGGKFYLIWLINFYNLRMYSYTFYRLAFHKPYSHLKLFIRVNPYHTLNSVKRVTLWVTLWVHYFYWHKNVKDGPKMARIDIVYFCLPTMAVSLSLSFSAYS